MNIGQAQFISAIIILFITVVSGTVILLSLLRRMRHSRVQPTLQHDSSVPTIPSALRRQPPKIVMPPARIVHTTGQPVTVTTHPKPAIIRPTENVPLLFTIDANQSSLSATPSN